MNQHIDFDAVMGILPGAMSVPMDVHPDTPATHYLPAVPDMVLPRAMLEPYRQEAIALCAAAQKLRVQDRDGQVAATNLAAELKKIAKTVENARKNYTGPVNEHLQAVNGLAKEISAPLDEGLRHLTGQLNSYASQVELERRKAEAAARRQAEEEQKRLDAEAKAAGVEAPLVPEVLPAETKTAAVRTEAGTSYQRKTWTFEVVDPAKLPREYMVLNESAVRAAIKNGVRNIPGLKIFETAQTVIR